MRGPTNPTNVRAGRWRAVPASLAVVLATIAALTLGAACSGSSTTAGPDVSTGDQAAPTGWRGPAGRRYD